MIVSGEKYSDKSYSTCSIFKLVGDDVLFLKPLPALDCE